MEDKKKKSGIRSTVILLMILFLGLGIFLYPTVSDWWNSFHQSRAITEYVSVVTGMDTEEQERMLREAEAYNRALLLKPDRYIMSEQEKAEYHATLDITGTGIMGYIEIPAIKVSLPIYHGTNEAELQIAIGHIEGTSLPVGGPGTHCALSGHRGLPSAKLFTDIDKLKNGDTFLVQVMDRTLTYMVDQVRIVLPEEMQDLAIDPEKDYCTLVTCTPYGINTHRLLVRGVRIENAAKTVAVTPDAIQLEPVLVAPLVAAPILLILIIALFLTTGKKARERAQRKDEIRKQIDDQAGGEPE